MDRFFIMVCVCWLGSESEMWAEIVKKTKKNMKVFSEKVSHLAICWLSILKSTEISVIIPSPSVFYHSSHEWGSTTSCYMLTFCLFWNLQKCLLFIQSISVFYHSSHDRGKKKKVTIWFSELSGALYLIVLMPICISFKSWPVYFSFLILESSLFFTLFSPLMPYVEVLEKIKWSFSPHSFIHSGLRQSIYGTEWYIITYFPSINWKVSVCVCVHMCVGESKNNHR